MAKKAVASFGPPVDPGEHPSPPAPDELEPLVSAMILSASGWRAVFSADGDENSDTERVRWEHLVIAAIAADVYGRHVLADPSVRTRSDAPLIVVGRDTRPTGKALARAAIRALLTHGLSVEYLQVAPSPEIMAYARASEAVDGFFYLTASHNPIGHNGIKFGLGDGSVIGGEKSRKIVADFRKTVEDPECILRAYKCVTALDVRGERDILIDSSPKHRSAANYLRMTQEVARGPGPDAERAFDLLIQELKRQRPGIVVDQNGSARCLTIDRELLEDIGCEVVPFNDSPGQIVHQIVPEGAGLEPCLEKLRELSESDSRFVFGYVPDNDGDRGNLVISEGPGSARQVEAQEVFALCAVAELTWLAHTGAIDTLEQPVAIAVNGPTSMRIEKIARRFGATVHRAEVGEANVVNLARELREQGYLVRFLGEGSNGGNITHPSTVRDPLQTLLSVLKFLYAPTGDGTSLLQSWYSRAGHTGSTDLPGVLSSLPRFTTTSAFSPEAAMRVRSPDHNVLKAKVEAIWEDTWPTLTAIRDRLALTHYAFINYEGTKTRPGKGNRTGAGRGGLKILLKAGDEDRAYLWMRGSGTEPVFRVLVDVEGHEPDTERELLTLLRSVVQQADS